MMNSYIKQWLHLHVTLAVGSPIEKQFVFEGRGSKLKVPSSPSACFTIIAYFKNEPVSEISNNVVCATSKASDQPAHKRSLIRAFASRLSIL